MSSDFLRLARPFLDAGVLSAADVHAVALVAPRFGERSAERMLGLAFAVRAPRRGHAGVDLGLAARQLDDERILGASRAVVEAAAEDALGLEAEAPAATLLEALPWPEAGGWQEATLSSPMVGAPAHRESPFVRQDLGEGTLLLTRRMYREQELVAAALGRRAHAAVAEPARLSNLEASLAALFPDEPEGEGARAVRLAAGQRLAVVIGGPGTGKTYFITRLLAALLSEDRGERPFHVALAAPTGKAAVRMREAIREATRADATPRLDVDARVRTALQALEATTLHRLLGVRPDGTARHDAAHPVPADVLVVDEVSMVDLVLMRRLVEAVGQESRLILLGDRDQLASVDAGCVLADIVGDGASGPLAASVQAFTKSRRFASAPDVALIAACLQSHATSLPGVPTEPSARVATAVDVFTGRAHAPNEGYPGRRVQWLGEPDSPGEGLRPKPGAAQLDALAAPYVEGFAELGPGGERRLEGYAALLKRFLLPTGQWSAGVREPFAQRTILDALDHYRVLAVHRRGPLGVAGLDRAFAERVRAFLSPGTGRDGGRYWVGRPILVTQNAYDVRLMNGDVGLVLPTPQGDAAVFPDDEAGEVRVVSLSRLPPHEGALAMTVHKSQGSQFDRVALVLAGRASPIQTRELVYTGVTRAKNQLVWLGAETELREALARRVTRASGLAALLGETPPT